MEITIDGSGTVFMCSVTRGDEVGILLRPVAESHEIDSTDPTWQDGQPYMPKENDVVIWCSSLASARVLQDRVNILALSLNRYAVIDTQ